MLQLRFADGSRAHIALAAIRKHKDGVLQGSAMMEMLGIDEGPDALARCPDDASDAKDAAEVIEVHALPTAAVWNMMWVFVERYATATPSAIAHWLLHDIDAKTVVNLWHAAHFFQITPLQRWVAACLAISGSTIDAHQTKLNMFGPHYPSLSRNRHIVGILHMATYSPLPGADEHTGEEEMMAIAATFRANTANAGAEMERSLVEPK